MIYFCFSDDVSFRALRVAKRGKTRQVRGWIVAGTSRVYAKVAEISPDVPSEVAINLCLARHAGSTRRMK